MKETDDFGAVVRQGIHETPLKGRHSDLLTVPSSGDVIMEAKTHKGKSVDTEKQKSQRDKIENRTRN